MKNRILIIIDADVEINSNPDNSENMRVIRNAPPQNKRSDTISNAITLLGFSCNLNFFFFTWFRIYINSSIINITIV